MDLAEVVRAVKAISPKARIVADGVAYAPHLPMDVQKWGVDWYASLLTFPGTSKPNFDTTNLAAILSVTS